MRVTVESAARAEAVVHEMLEDALMAGQASVAFKDMGAPAGCAEPVFHLPRGG